MLWPWIICGILTLVVIALLIKIAVLRRAADEICAQFKEKLEHDTNTLISISSGDRHMRRLASEINAQLRLLRDERHRFQRGDLELKEAVTNISHDLRTPLTAIMGYLNLLEREEKSEAVARYTAMIENRAEALKQLTEELFSYSVLVSAPDGASYSLLSLGAALEESLSANYAVLTERGIAPEVSIPETAVERRLDPGSLSRIFGNIIGNAVKYSDGDLCVTLREDGEIVFSNTARSLNTVAVGRLFDRFFTVESGRGGAGLGLSIAKLLTEQMGGSISAAYESDRLSVILRF